MVVLSVHYSKCDVPEGKVKVTKTFLLKCKRRFWETRGEGAAKTRKRTSRTVFTRKTVVEVVPIDAEYIKNADIIESSNNFEPRKEVEQRGEASSIEFSSGEDRTQSSSEEVIELSRSEGSDTIEEVELVPFEVDPEEPESSERFPGLSRLYPTLRIEEFLGAGSFGRVYRAVYTVDGTQLAVKVFESEETALEEVRAMQLVANQPLLPKLLDFFEFNGKYFVLMHLVPGEDLFSLTRAKRNVAAILPEKAVRHIMWQTLSTLETLHESHLAFHDLKLENIVVDPSTGIARLIDVGCIRYFDSSFKGNCMGTLRYMPPEIFIGNYYLSPPAKDVWAAGIVALELLTGDFPFHGDSWDSLQFEFSNLPLDFLRRFQTRMSPMAFDFVQWAMQLLPWQRPSVSELMEHPWFTTPIW